MLLINAFELRAHLPPLSLIKFKHLTQGPHCGNNRDRASHDALYLFETAFTAIRADIRRRNPYHTRHVAWPCPSGAPF